MLFYSSSATPASVAGARGSLKEMAEWTGLEPATPGVTGRYSNQLNYHSACWWVLRGSNPRPSPCKGDALPAELSTLWKRRGSLRFPRASRNVFNALRATFNGVEATPSISARCASGKPRQSGRLVRPDLGLDARRLAAPLLARNHLGRLRFRGHGQGHRHVRQRHLQ